MKTKFRLDMSVKRTYRKKIKIQKGIPVPDAMHPLRGTRYPFNKMKKGDSFAIKYTDNTSKILVRGRLSGPVSKLNKKGKAKYTTRTLAKEIRVWRIK